MFDNEIILTDNYRSDAISTVNALALNVTDKTKLTRLMKLLSTSLPMSKISMKHLKRINSKHKNNVDEKLFQILICPVQTTTIDQQVEDNSDEQKLIKQTINNLQMIDENLYKILAEEYDLDDFFIVKVARENPLTRIQFQRLSSLWPLNYFENKYITKCMDGSIYTNDQWSKIHELMNETLNMLTYEYDSSSTSKTSETAKTTETSKTSSSPLMAAIIVKDNGKRIVTKTISRSTNTNHPLHHAVIVAIMNVSNLHRNSKQQQQQQQKILNNPDYSNLSENDNYENDYLCNDYDCFLSQEPCIMCAMALIHSRIRRVFFFEPSSSSSTNNIDNECSDQPYTMEKLHQNANLNHRHEVWRLTRKCKKQRII